MPLVQTFTFSESETSLKRLTIFRRVIKILFARYKSAISAISARNQQAISGASRARARIRRVYSPDQATVGKIISRSGSKH